MSRCNHAALAAPRAAAALPAATRKRPQILVGPRAGGLT
jgi:hypothetical protein